MLSSGLVGLSQASSNAMLSANASRAIGAYLQRHELDARQVEVVGRAADFLERIAAGAHFVANGQMAGYARPHQALEEYDRALSAFHTLNLVSQNSEFIPVFQTYCKRLRGLAAGETIESDLLTNLKRFLNALSEMFYSDMRRPIVGHRSEPFASEG